MRWRSFLQRNNTKNNQAENFSIELVKDLNENIKNLENLLGKPDDLVVRKFRVRGTNHRCAIAYIEGLVDTQYIRNQVMSHIQLDEDLNQIPDQKQALFETLYEEIMSATAVKKKKTLDDLSKGILSGSTIFYLDGLAEVFVISSQGWEKRQIQEPVSETLIRGPREGFVENIRTNIVLIRRYIQDPNLRFETHKVGRRSKKNLVVSYVDGVIHPDIVQEVNRRLQTIDMDDAPETGFIEQWIEDSFLSPFPQMMNTERPDKVAASLLQGKVAILLDGTPFVLIAPTTLGNSLQSPEDYYERWTVGSLLRVLRYIAAFIAVFLPAVYVALVSFHPGMIPSDLAFSIAASREGVPFTPFVEALLMSGTMELLREAGARLPKTIGQTIGIVGGLVIGDAAVRAGVVSPIMVIVVALNAIASFSLPAYSIAIAFRIILFGILILSGILGLYGIILGYIMINIHIVNLKSIGVPYSTPYAPTFYRDWMDLFVRLPITVFTKRPKYMKPMDKSSANKGDH
ncbi:spore germination protein [Gracilibacillus halophilus YIM-C55.5]|uniref:Spore germination protein n=1 Tax=Gracilibacillus halophilus YIM-C55.5 TaxID=1308866 RepID=N4WKF8_9BACI|nr:spore germination protein [Gracilibacillus halophilus]ENH96632.1 spore germination protein [Gracilibacillus halophilus YIM-C55.5]